MKTQTSPLVDPSLPSSLLGTRLLKPGFVSHEERRALEAAVSPPRHVRHGIDLAREGDCADSLFILAEGWACRYTSTGDGGRQLPALLVPGDVGNLDSLMFDRLDYGLRTLTNVTVLTLPRDRALALAVGHEGIARTFTWLALVENAILGKWTLSLGRRSARERLAHLLCELSVRLGGGEEGESRYDLPLTQEHLADALGLTPVHVNRTMQQLRSEGLIVGGSRRMTLPDVGRLRQVAGFNPRYLHRDAMTDGQSS